MKSIEAKSVVIGPVIGICVMLAMGQNRIAEDTAMHN